MANPRPLEREINGGVYTADPMGGTGYIGQAQPQATPQPQQPSTPGARSPHHDPWYTKILHSTRFGLGMMPGVNANEGEPSTPQWNPLGPTKKSSGKTSPTFDASKIQNWHDWANPSMVTDDQIMNLTTGDMEKITNSFAKQIIASRQQKIFDDFQKAQSPTASQDPRVLLQSVWSQQVQPFVKGLVDDSRSQAKQFATSTAAAQSHGGLPSSVAGAFQHNDQIAAASMNQLADAMAQSALVSPLQNDLLSQLTEANNLRGQQVAALRQQIAAQSLGGGAGLSVPGVTL